eukprot:NODE_1388_length_889_cov_305.940476_g1145_i0.p3 GENE.NODE_1388_length_889_cov_305.940476_g1145_i0~~NODE_1388_length_889_cov_305.940476_g1145_i0.p3  ORF type:complete len:77 (-),score=1.65 NODE_1388_length_889_cov_305.940476_g1145_i0:603-833(-)
MVLESSVALCERPYSVILSCYESSLPLSTCPCGCGPCQLCYQTMNACARSCNGSSWQDFCNFEVSTTRSAFFDHIC